MKKKKEPSFIKSAQYLSGYCLEVLFEDGVIRDIDLQDFLENSNHPLINKYLDIELFKQFYIDGGTLCWGDNEFDLNPFSIYEGEFSMVHA